MSRLHRRVEYSRMRGVIPPVRVRAVATLQPSWEQCLAVVAVSAAREECLLRIHFRDRSGAIRTVPFPCPLNLEVAEEADLSQRLTARQSGRSEAAPSV